MIASDGLSVELGDFLDTGTALLADGDGLAGLTLVVQPGASTQAQSTAVVVPEPTGTLQMLVGLIVPFIIDQSCLVLRRGI